MPSVTWLVIAEPKVEGPGGLLPSPCSWYASQPERFCPPENISMSRDILVVTTRGGGRYWPLIGRGQGCSQVPYNAQDSLTPTTQTVHSATNGKHGSMRL